MSHADPIANLLADESSLGTTFRTFSPDDRRAMLEEDLFAGRSVTGVLLAIVVMGTLMMFGTVLMTM
jgi:hypothetical protein